ncbi:MAG: pilus assembly protein HicB [Bacteroidales bacterium]|nr:pilus assembly protein HicB [Bacteroidales bacterium]
MKAKVLIEKDGNGFSAVITNFKSTIFGEGATVEEAKADLMNSIEEVRASYAEQGRTSPDGLDNLTFEYQYDVSAFFDAFSFLNVSRFAERVGISPSLMRHYKAGGTYISSAQAKKIEAGLHQIARELQAVSL